MKKENDNLIGVIGDLHMKDYLSYADYISDGRAAEKREILDFIVDSFKDCPHVVFMGDNFNSRNNTSETNREFVEFLERFGKKEVYIISGNHEKKGNGKTAIDFLREIDHPNWHIYTEPHSHEIEGMQLSFLPYMLKSELTAESNEEAARKILKLLPGGDILFAHHAISGTTFNGIKVETFPEPVLNKEKLEKKYKLVAAGHIHSPMLYGKTLITGSVFTDSVGEKEKFIFKISKSLAIETLTVPARPIYKLEDPSEATIAGLPGNSIVKVTVTKKGTDIDYLKEIIGKSFDAFLLIEDYPNKRKKVHIEEGGAFDFSIEALLKLYSEAKEVNYQKLLRGLELINGK